MDLILERCRNQDGDRQLEQLLVADEAADLLPQPARELFLTHHLVELDAVLVVARAVRVADRDHLAAGLGQQLGRGVTHVADALDRHGRIFGTDAKMLQRGQRGQHAATPGGFRAAFRAADTQRLAGHDRRHRMAGLHADRVHHPGHDLGVGIDVRRGDIAVGTDHDADLAGVAPRQVFELVAAEQLGVDDHAPLGAPVRDANNGALPRHPHGQGFDFLPGHAGVIPDAAFRRTAIDVVVNAVAGEHLDGVVVHQHRKGHGQLALTLAQHPRHVRIKTEHIGRDIELLLGHRPRVRRLWHCLGEASARHRFYLLGHDPSCCFTPAK